MSHTESHFCLSLWSLDEKNNGHDQFQPHILMNEQIFKCTLKLLASDHTNVLFANQQRHNKFNIVMLESGDVETSGLWSVS